MSPSKMQQLTVALDAITQRNETKKRWKSAKPDDTAAQLPLQRILNSYIHRVPFAAGFPCTSSAIDERRARRPLLYGVGFSAFHLSMCDAT